MRIVVGITGASGSILGIKLVRQLLLHNCELRLVFTENGKKVTEFELKQEFDELVKDLSLLGNLAIEDNGNMFSAIASGSFPCDAMIISPCSMGTLAKIACGISDSLITRAADVTLKERRPLILVARESPLNAVQLENMLKLAKLGVCIAPPIPDFYNGHATTDEITDSFTGRIMRLAGIENKLFREWGGSVSC